MRFLFKALLAATALVPVASAAVAQEAPERIGRGWNGDRSEPTPQPDAPPPQPRAERGGGDWVRRAESSPAPQAREVRAPEPQQRQWAERRPDGRDGGGRADRQPDGAGQQWAGRAEQRPAPVSAQPNVATGRPGGPDRGDPRGYDRPGDRQGWNWQQQARRDDRRSDDRRTWNQPNRNDRGGWDRRDDVRAGGWNGQRGGDRFDDRSGWNRTWRSDRRYDWNGYRSTNRSAYRLPRYYAPYGWSYGYRRFSIGATLSNLLWGENYWIDDPYAYRLPAVYGPYRWVRYYDDALLVDIRTGRVVDVVYDIFW